MSLSVIVVGAGIAGLTAAHRLRQNGFRVQVLERQSVVGGRMSDRQTGPIAYNTGARLVYPFGAELHALIDEMGLRHTLVALKNLNALCNDGRADYRIDLMPGLRALRTPGLTLGDKMSLMRAGLHLAWLRRSSNPDEAISALAYDHETLADYIRRMGGTRVLELLVEPVFRGTRSWNPEDISAAFYLSTTPALLGEDTVYALKGGMGLLTRRLADTLDVQCDVDVTSISRDADGCTVRYRQAGGACELSADLVVCATEGQYVRDVVHGAQAEEQRMHAAVRYNSLGIVHYSLRGASTPTLEFALRKSATRISTWQLSAAAPVDGEARSVLYCQLTPEAVQEAIDLSCTDDIDHLLREEICSRIPGFNDRVVYVFNQWIACKLPIFYPGYGKEVASFLEWQQSSRRRVYYCGDYLAQSLLNGACHSGSSAARTIARHWQ